MPAVNMYLYGNDIFFLLALFIDVRNYITLQLETQKSPESRIQQIQQLAKVSNCSEEFQNASDCVWFLSLTYALHRQITHSSF